VKDPDAPGEISINPDTLKTVAASSNDFINPVNYVTKNSVTLLAKLTLKTFSVGRIPQAARAKLLKIPTSSLIINSQKKLRILMKLKKMLTKVM
jgi:hypothetical protein